MSFKPYPCGSLSHPTMDAMLKVVIEHDLKPDQIKAVRVRAGSNILEPLRYKIATNELEAKFCLPFLMSSLIIRRKAGVREFTDEFVASAPVQQMMPRVTNVFDPKIEAQGFDKIRSVVEIDLTDGRTLVQASDDRYRGGPDKPFTREELHEKFTDCAQLTLGAARLRESARFDRGRRQAQGRDGACQGAVRCSRAGSRKVLTVANAYGCSTPAGSSTESDPPPPGAASRAGGRSRS